FFLEKINSNMKLDVKDPTTANIIINELGYKSIDDYIHYLLDYDHDAGFNDILACYLKEYMIETKINMNSSILDLDEELSGPYIITITAIKKIIHFDCNIESYIKQWNLFLESLTNLELKNMLLSFTNSTSIH